ncbi:MAG: hypothetical protein JST49_09980 [Bacteroidetes bacterium]|nr:hypothetical protein [Bacteroidota bacterium]
MNNEKEMAYALSTYYGLPNNDVERLVSVPAGTVQKWKRKQGWDKMVATNNMAPARLVEECYNQCSTIMEDARKEKRQLTDAEVNRFNKLVSTANKLDYEHSPRVHMEVLMKFNNYLVQCKPQLAREVVTHEMDYAKELMKKTYKMPMKTKNS